MAQEIEFSVISTTRMQVEFIESCIADFERQTHIHVNLHWLGWPTARAELVKMALYRHGADVSEVGSTWINDLISMDALRPFSPRELMTLGGPQAFIPAAWMTGQTPLDQEVWAIPWVVSAVIIAYRRDILQRVGLDEASAFKTFRDFEETLAKIQASGWETPLSLPVQGSRYSTLHNIASWIWGAGGDFLDSQAKKVTLHEPTALEAMKRYYGLRRYFPGDFAGREDKTFSHARAFWQGQAATTVGGCWLVASPANSVEVANNMAAAPLPGPAFVGAQSLVVWQHSRNPAAAFELTRYLTSLSVMNTYANKIYLLPARLELLSTEQYAAAPFNVLAQAAKTGRSLPLMALLGLVEDKVSLMLENLWLEIFSSPDAEIDAIFQKRVTALANQLNATLSS